MKKFTGRFIVLLLIPCLIVDPATANCFRDTPGPAIFQPSAIREYYTGQALTLSLSGARFLGKPFNAGLKTSFALALAVGLALFPFVHRASAQDTGEKSKIVRQGDFKALQATEDFKKQLQSENLEERREAVKKLAALLDKASDHGSRKVSVGEIGRDPKLLAMIFRDLFSLLPQADPRRTHIAGALGILVSAPASGMALGNLFQELEKTAPGSPLLSDTLLHMILHQQKGLDVPFDQNMVDGLARIVLKGLYDRTFPIDTDKALTLLENPGVPAELLKKSDLFTVLDKNDSSSRAIPENTQAQGRIMRIERLKKHLIEKELLPAPSSRKNLSFLWLLSALLAVPVAMVAGGDSSDEKRNPVLRLAKAYEDLLTLIISDDRTLTLEAVVVKYRMFAQDVLETVMSAGLASSPDEMRELGETLGKADAVIRETSDPRVLIRAIFDLDSFLNEKLFLPFSDEWVYIFQDTDRTLRLLKGQVIWWRLPFGKKDALTIILRQSGETRCFYRSEEKLLVMDSKEAARIAQLTLSMFKEVEIHLYPKAVAREMAAFLFYELLVLAQTSVGDLLKLAISGSPLEKWIASNDLDAETARMEVQQILRHLYYLLVVDADFMKEYAIRILQHDQQKNTPAMQFIDGRLQVVLKSTVPYRMLSKMPVAKVRAIAHKILKENLNMLTEGGLLPIVSEDGRTLRPNVLIQAILQRIIPLVQADLQFIRASLDEGKKANIWAFFEKAPPGYDRTREQRFLELDRKLSGLSIHSGESNVGGGGAAAPAESHSFAFGPGRPREHPEMQPDAWRLQLIAALSFMHPSSSPLLCFMPIGQLLEQFDFLEGDFVATEFLIHAHQTTLKLAEQLTKVGKKEEPYLGLVRFNALVEELQQCLDVPKEEMKFYLERLLPDKKEIFQDFWAVIRGLFQQLPEIVADGIALSKGEDVEGAHAILSDVITDFKARYPDTVIFDDSDPRLAPETQVAMSPFRLFSLLNNLIANAIKHRRAGDPPPHVKVSMDEATGHVKFAISDQGPGIPPSRYHNLFDLIAYGGRIHVGLPQIRDIIYIADGTLALDTRQGAGTTWTITLPLFTPATPAKPLLREAA